MASTINNDGAFSPASTTIVLRANSAGNPIWHNQVDGNFENLRLGHNQVVTELATKSVIGHVHSVVTTSVNGFMSSADKAKLDGVASGANNYALPTATSSTKGGVKVGSNLIIQSEAIGVPTSSSSTYGVVKYDNSTIKLNGTNQLYVVDDGHAALTNNPHNVTASQVGLGSVVSDIATLNNNVNQINSSISGISSDLTGVESNVSSISSSISGLTSSSPVLSGNTTISGSLTVSGSTGIVLSRPNLSPAVSGSIIQDEIGMRVIPGSSYGSNEAELALEAHTEVDGRFKCASAKVMGNLEVLNNGNLSVDGDLTVNGSISASVSDWKNGNHTTLTGSNKHFNHSGVVWTQNIWSQFPGAKEVFILAHLGEAYLYYWDVYEPSWKIAGAVGDNQGGVKGCTIRCSPGTDNNVQYEDQDGTPDIAAGTIKFHAALAPGDENTADVLWIKVIKWR